MVGEKRYGRQHGLVAPETVKTVVNQRVHLHAQHGNQEIRQAGCPKRGKQQQTRPEYPGMGGFHQHELPGNHRHAGKNGGNGHPSQPNNAQTPRQSGVFPQRITVAPGFGQQRQRQGTDERLGRQVEAPRAEVDLYRKRKKQKQGPVTQSEVAWRVDHEVKGAIFR